MKKLVKKLKTRKKLKELHNNAKSSFDEAIISWVAPETLRYQRGKIWKFLAISITLAATTLAYLYDSWTFSLVIIASALAMYSIHKSEPKDVEVIISDIGVKVANRRYPYSRIKAFWMVYEMPYANHLTLEVEGEMPREVIIQMHGQNPASVRDILTKKIPEAEGKSERLSNIFLRLFKL